MGYSQWIKECAVSIGRRLGVGGDGADQATANGAEESGTVPGVPNSSENDAGERADGYRSRAKQVIAATVRRREERGLWASADTLEELGEVTARWAEGDIKYHPGGYDQGPDEETRGIAPALATLNRAGFVTSGSQPGEAPVLGYDGAWWRQRAAVDGFTDTATADRLEAVCADAGLMFIRNGPAKRRTTWKNSVIVTSRAVTIDAVDADHDATTGFGTHLSRHAVKFQFDGYGADALLAAEQVTIIDPEWGRETHLWDTLTNAVNPSSTAASLAVPELEIAEVAEVAEPELAELEVPEVVVPSESLTGIAIEPRELDVAEPVGAVPDQVTMPDPVVAEVVVAVEPPATERVLQSELIEPEVTAVTAVMEPPIEVIEVAEPDASVQLTPAYPVEQPEVPVGVTKPVVEPAVELVKVTDSVAVPEVLGPQPEGAIGALVHDGPTTTTTGPALETTAPVLNEPTLTELDELTLPAEITTGEQTPAEKELCSYCDKPHFVGIGDIETTVEKTDPVAVAEPVVTSEPEPVQVWDVKPETQREVEPIRTVSPQPEVADLAKKWANELKSGRHTQTRGEWESHGLLSGHQVCAAMVAMNTLGPEGYRKLEAGLGEDYISDVIDRNDWRKQSFREIGKHIERTALNPRRRDHSWELER